MIVHAGLLALRDGRTWRGALIRGPSGVGKSDLALRALEAGFRLVADDRVVLWASGGRLFGKAPATLASRIEARGLGVLAQDALAFCQVALIVDCVAAEAVERLPEPVRETLLGVDSPRVALAPLEPSAATKLRLAFTLLG